MTGLGIGHLFGSNRHEERVKTLFDEHYADLCVFADRLLHDFAEAEDLVQNVFIKFLASGENLADKSNPKAYIYRTVYNTCLNHIAGRRTEDNRRKKYLEHMLVDAREDYELGVIEIEVLNRIYDEIEALPAECRKVFRMSYIDGKDVATVAQELGISVNTVKTQRQRGRKILQERLKDIFVAVPVLLAILFR